MSHHNAKEPTETSHPSAELPVPENLTHPEIDEAREDIQRLVDNTELLSLVSLLDREARDSHANGDSEIVWDPVSYADMSPDQKLDFLKSFAAVHFQDRKGASRDEAETDEISSAVEQAVWRTVESLNMQGDVLPSKKEFEVAAILGAKGANVYARTLYLKELMDSGHMPKVIFALGSERPLSTPTEKDPIPEADKAHFYTDGDAKTEFDLMCRAIEDIFGISALSNETISFSSSSEVPGQFDRPVVRPLEDRWKVQAYESEGYITTIKVDDDEIEVPIPIIAISAPIVDGRGIANTADTYAFTRSILGDWFTKEHLGHEPSLIAISNSIFAFQRMDARRLFGVPFGAHVELAGFATDHFTGERALPPARGFEDQGPQGSFEHWGVQYHMREVNSYIRRAWRLQMLIDEVETDV